MTSSRAWVVSSTPRTCDAGAAGSWDSSPGKTRRRNSSARSAAGVGRDGAPSVGPTSAPCWQTWPVRSADDRCCAVRPHRARGAPHPLGPRVVRPVPGLPHPAGRAARRPAPPPRRRRGLHPLPARRADGRRRRLPGGAPRGAGATHPRSPLRGACRWGPGTSCPTSSWSRARRSSATSSWASGAPSRSAARCGSGTCPTCSATSRRCRSCCRRSACTMPWCGAGSRIDAVPGVPLACSRRHRGARRVPAQRLLQRLQHARRRRRAGDAHRALRRTPGTPGRRPHPLDGRHGPRGPTRPPAAHRRGAARTMVGRGRLGAHRFARRVPRRCTRARRRAARPERRAALERKGEPADGRRLEQGRREGRRRGRGAVAGTPGRAARHALAGRPTLGPVAGAGMARGGAQRRARLDLRVQPRRGRRCGAAPVRRGDPHRHRDRGPCGRRRRGAHGPAGRVRAQPDERGAPRGRRAGPAPRRRAAARCPGDRAASCDRGAAPHRRG